MSSKLPTPLVEEGPKLREEKHYQDFYPDLDQQAMLPLFVTGEVQTNNSLKHTLPHTKQIIFNDKVTIEPIAFNIHKARFKKCKIKISDLSGTQPIGKKYYRLGYRYNSHQGKFDEELTPYLKKTDSYDSAKEDPFSHFSKYQSHFKVEYDMDEQDELYLRFLNQTRVNKSRKAITHEIFEVLMSVLENEWFHLEKKTPPRTSPSSDVYSPESKAAWDYYEAYGSDDGTGYALDQPCAVCGGTESDNSNAIVFCDGCDVAVHQECYGIVFIPEGQWLCRRCMISRNRKINCLFCPSHTGAFKQTDTGSWGHVVCGIWIPELFFVNTHYMEPIEGVDQIPKSRWRLNCYICKQKLGACIQCSNKNCFTAYHVTCAKRAGLCMDFGGCSISEVSSNLFPPGTKLQSFCDKHSPPGWADCREGILKTRVYFGSVNDIKALELKRDESSPKVTSKGKWKTNRGTPIAPYSFALVVGQVLESFEIDNREQTALDVCKYWSMKRELKRGASLVRKFDPSSFNTFSTDELQKRAQFAEILLNDLDKLHGLGSLLVKRQQTTKRLNEADHRCRKLAHHPISYLIKTTILDDMGKMEQFKHLLKEETTKTGLNSIISSCSLEKYDDISAFKDDISKYFNDISNNEKASRKTQMKASAVFSEFKRRLSVIEGINVTERIKEDFEIEGDNITLAKWKGPKLMEKENLSDVEDLNPGDLRKVRTWLK